MPVSLLLAPAGSLITAPAGGCSMCAGNVGMRGAVRMYGHLATLHASLLPPHLPRIAAFLGVEADDDGHYFVNEGER